MARVWLGATHSSRPPASGEVGSPGDQPPDRDRPTGTDPTDTVVARILGPLRPRPAQQHGQRDSRRGSEPGPGRTATAPPWLRWFTGR